MYRLLARYQTALALLIPLCVVTPAMANEDPAPPPATAEKNKSDTDDKTRGFYQVLEDLLADFEYDLKNNEVSGLKDLAIRSLATSENVPPSFRSHLELLITERILKNNKGVRIIQCLPCKAKKATLSGDSVTISAPDANPVEMMRIARASGIQTFMDVAFAYQPKGMLLSMYLVDPETSSVIWSRSYNSETSRTAAFRRGVDYSQIDEARKQTEYKPTLQYRLTVYYLLERDINNYAGTLGFGLRLMERYDNRTKEVGFELNYIRDISSIAGSPSASTTSLYTGLNLTLLFMHAWNFIGHEENYNSIRGSLFGGIGGTYASGYLGGLVRVGFEWRMAKHWAVSVLGGYRPESTAFLPDSTSRSVSGFELGFGINALF